MDSFQGHLAAEQVSGVADGEPLAHDFATDLQIRIASLIFYVLCRQFRGLRDLPLGDAALVDISGSLIVIAGLVGAALLGVVGALLAIPTAAAISVLLKDSSYAVRLAVSARRYDVTPSA